MSAKVVDLIDFKVGRDALAIVPGPCDVCGVQSPHVPGHAITVCVKCGRALCRTHLLDSGCCCALNTRCTICDVVVSQGVLFCPPCEEMRAGGASP